MNGIAIVIPNADFSGSPLGKVTFVKSAAERAEKIVNQYVNTVGEIQEKPKLVSLVTSLISEGLWDNLDIYPMLGTDKLVNLNSESGYLKKNLVVPANAVLDGDGIVFDKGSNLAKPVPNSISTTNILAKDIPNYYMYSNLNIPSGSYLRYLLYNGSSGNLNVRFTSSNVLIVSMSPVSATTPSSIVGTHKIAVSVGDSGLSLYVDNYKVSEVQQDWATTIMGYCISDGLGSDYTGTVSLYVQGFIPHDKHEKANKIFSTFVG